MWIVTVSDAYSDAYFRDRALAALYDRIEAGAPRADEAFYLQLMKSEHDVLDVGCGTGWLLRQARSNGHTGRLVGIDPADGMFEQASRHRDIEWRQVTLPAAGFHGEFDLIVMTGHAFQALRTDEQILEFLDAARRALNVHGRLAFETRNPLARAWERWDVAAPVEVPGDEGAPVTVRHHVESVDGELITFTETFECAAWPETRVSRSTLRFVHAEHLDHLLTLAGLSIHERYGFWDRSPFTPHSPEIITVAALAG